MSILTGLDAAAISQLSATRIRALTMADIGSLTAAQLPGLAASQLALFSPLQLLALGRTQVPYLSPAAVSGLTTGHVAMLLPAQVAALTADQIAAFSPAQIAALNAGDILAMSPAQIKALTETQVGALTIAQFSVLNPADIAAFSPEQVASISTRDIAILNPVQLKTLTPTQLAALTTAQIAALTPAQLKTLNAAQLSALGSDPVVPATPISPVPTPPAPTIPTPAPPLNDTPIPAPPAPANDTPTPPAPTNDTPVLTPTIPTPTPPAPANDTPAPTPPAPANDTPVPTPTIPTPTPPAPANDTPVPTPPAPANDAPIVTPPAPANDTPPAVTTPPSPSVTPSSDPATAPQSGDFTPSQLSAMTGAQFADLTADQINALTAEQLAAIHLDYAKMLAVLQADAAGGMTAGEFGALKALAAKLNIADGISVSPYLQQISQNVILGNAANATWTGGGSVAVPLGNLSATSSEVQVNELIGKWFLGTDLPASKVKIDLAPNFKVTHTLDAAPLYDSGISMYDVNQGNLGDCFFLASVAEVAARDPSSIESMITDNGNGTYGVCFTVNGKADYVTVNDELANGGTIFNHGADDWAGLLEKAYAQLQAGGNVTGNPTGYGNSYTNLANGGSPESALAALTGATTVIDYVADGASWKTYAFDGASLTVPNNPKAATVTASSSGMSSADLLAQLSADLEAGDFLVLSSNKAGQDASGKATLMADHAMAVYDIDRSTGMLEIYNPWGTATGGYQPWETTFEVGLSQLLSDGDIISVATSRPVTGLMAANPGTLHPATGIGTAPSLLGLAGVG